MEETNNALSEKVIGFLKNNWKKIAIIVVALVVASNFFSCGGSEYEDGGTKNDQTHYNADGIEPNQWYHNDLVNFQNCIINSSTVKNSGGVFVNYSPVCSECGQTATISSMAVVSQEESLLKGYYCDCGAQTAVRISVY